ncbi:MAG: calcium-binding protein [Pseudomonadota bacterium]
MNEISTVELKSFFPEFEAVHLIDCFGPLLLTLEDVERELKRGTSEADYLVGTDYHDLLVGGAGDDTLLGSKGRDELRGGAGVDEADYSGSSCGVSVDLAGGTGWGGHAHGDTFSGIENLRGSNYADTLEGSRFDNRIDGGNGADLIRGQGGNDNLRGGVGAANDTLFGGDGDDELYGGKGQNSLTGDAGADVFKLYFIDTETTIEDFTVGEDTLHLIGFFGYEYFIKNAVDTGGNVVFSRYNDYLNYTSTLVIENLQLADLSRNDFMFN